MRPTTRTRRLRRSETRCTTTRSSSACAPLGGSDSSRRSMGRRPLAPPDPQPARLVGSVLAYDRRLGVDFLDAWNDALDAVAALPPHRRDGWETALNETQAAWQSAYDGTSARAALDRTLLD